MPQELQHCAECREEYVAGVGACVECGGPLQAGPLPRGAARVGAGAVAATTSPLQRMLGRWPGLQADHAVRVLVAEGLACRVECQGSSKTYEAGQPPSEPFAVTLPVTVYVSDARFDDAEAILRSFEQDDVIGDQWTDTPAEPASADGSDRTDEDAAPASPASRFAQPEADPPLDPPVAETTSLRTAVVIVLAAIALLLLLWR